MGKYASKYVGVNPAPTDWTKIGDIAVDTLGIASSANLPFNPGVDPQYDNGYIIISDTRNTNLIGRTTGGGAGIAQADVPTYWATNSKSYIDLINLAKRLPISEGYNIRNLTEVLSFFTAKNYWSSYDEKLVAYFDASNYDSYPLGGTTWNDISGFNNNGTITNTLFVDTSSFGEPGPSYFIFRGNEPVNPQDYVYINQPIPTDSDYTIMAWVYSLNSSGAHNIVSTRNAPFYTAGGKLTAGVAGNNFVVQDTQELPRDVWKFVAVTFINRGTMNLYIDGSLVDTSSTVGGYTSDKVYIGGYYDNPPPQVSDFWDGYISEVKIYTRAFTDIEISNEFGYRRNFYGV